MEADVRSVGSRDVLTARVLVIGGRDISTNRIVSILRRNGFDVVTCSEGMEGMMKLDESPCQVVILDEGLPNCRETCQQIREVFHVPVLLLGDHSDDGYWQRTESMEIDAHVPKTVSGRELIAWMRTILRRYADAD